MDVYRRSKSNGGARRQLRLCSRHALTLKYTRCHVLHSDAPPQPVGAKVQYHQYRLDST